MQCSAIILLLTICAVNASVININIYGDNHEVSKTVDDCNFQACDQLCRNLGFPGGACVGDRCDCDNFKPASIDDLKVFHSGEDSKVSHGNSMEDCNSQACDQLCRWIGYPGGACVGDRCECDNFKRFRNHLTEHQSHKISTCDTIMCDDMCHRLNYAGGMCEHGNCQCY